MPIRAMRALFRRKDPNRFAQWHTDSHFPAVRGKRTGSIGRRRGPRLNQRSSGLSAVLWYVLNMRKARARADFVRFSGECGTSTDSVAERERGGFETAVSRETFRGKPRRALEKFSRRSPLIS